MKEVVVTTDGIQCPIRINDVYGGDLKEPYYALQGLPWRELGLGGFELELTCLTPDNVGRIRYNVSATYDECEGTWIKDFSLLDSDARRATRIFPIRAVNSDGLAMTRDDTTGDEANRTRYFGFCLRHPPILLCGRSPQIASLLRGGSKSGLLPYALTIIKSIEFIDGANSAVNTSQPAATSSDGVSAQMSTQAWSKGVKQIVVATDSNKCPIRINDVYGGTLDSNAYTLHGFAGKKLGFDSLSLSLSCLRADNAQFIGAFVSATYDEREGRWVKDLSLGDSDARRASRIFPIRAVNSNGLAMTRDDTAGSEESRTRYFGFCLRHPPVALCGSTDAIASLYYGKNENGLLPYALTIIKSIKFVDGKNNGAGAGQSAAASSGRTGQDRKSD